MTKGIIAIEAWEAFDREPRPRMKNLLDFITIVNDTKYTYNFVYTPDELKYILQEVPTKDSSLLYLALHGEPSKIKVGSKKEYGIKINSLAQWMGKRFKGYGVHFASCATLNGWMDSLRKFKKQTGVTFVSGYSKYVYFSTSSVADHILLSEWMYSTYYRPMYNRIMKRHKIFMKENGFEFLM